MSSSMSNNEKEFQKWVWQPISRIQYFVTFVIIVIVQTGLQWVAIRAFYGGLIVSDSQLLLAWRLINIPAGMIFMIATFKRAKDTKWGNTNWVWLPTLLALFSLSSPKTGLPVFIVMLFFGTARLTHNVAEANIETDPSETDPRVR